MTLPRALATALFLLTLTFCPSLPARAPSGDTPPGLHQRIVARLATPDVAVALAGAGILLIFLECNLPGAILPGATGLLLLLSGVYGLSLHPLRPSSVAVLLLAGLTLAVAPRLPLPGITAAFGSAALIFALANLIPPTSPSGRIHPLVALLVGAAVGLSTTLLGRVAERARRNKAVLPSGAKA